MRLSNGEVLHNPCSNRLAEYCQQLEQYKQQQSQTITGITNAITSIGGDVTGTQEDKTWIITS